MIGAAGAAGAVGAVGAAGARGGSEVRVLRPTDFGHHYPFGWCSFVEFPAKHTIWMVQFGDHSYLFGVGRSERSAVGLEASSTCGKNPEK